ncbi:MAG: response regulator [Calditrichota bacterium]
MNRILVLTTDQDLFSVVEDSLNKLEKVEIKTFDHSLELVNHYLSHYASLIILDIDLLKHETFQMIQVLRSIHAQTKIVLFLSPENMPICSSALSIGVLSYQIKPISEEKLVEIIASLLQITVNH